MSKCKSKEKMIWHSFESSAVYKINK